MPIELLVGSKKNGVQHRASLLNKESAYLIHVGQIRYKISALTCALTRDEFTQRLESRFLAAQGNHVRTCASEGSGDFTAYTFGSTGNEHLPK